ncbi:MAG: TonB-linked SusC/RagA family outer membrane protein [Saprospiraceae bacterium]|jgi:TonB-linked SusC/RagA family outer membrane protein
MKKTTLQLFLPVLLLCMLGMQIGYGANAEANGITNTSVFETTVSGTVLDNDGLALIGVNIIEKGNASNGTITDIDGSYSFTVADDATLVFSYTGFETQEVLVSGRTSIDISLLEGNTLDEVVVVGYGTQKKVNLTGAVSSVSGKVLAARPIANVGEGLQGVIPNLNVNIRNGDPAAGIDFNIRGYESINGGAPLILVDGVPMDLNKVNPNDIESISVLKDASAAAVYGARAAFGVVLVTTKSGKDGSMKVTFGAEYALSKPILFIDPVTDPYAYVQARDLATYRTNGSGFTQDVLDGTRRYSENPTEENAWGVVDGSLQYYGYNDYQNQIITNTSPQKKYDMSVSGGTDKSSYYVSLGYLSKDGYLKNSEKNENFKRYNALIKGSVEVKPWLSFDSRLLVTTEKSNKPHFYNWDVNINTTARVNPLNPITFPDLDHYLVPGDRDQYTQYIGQHFQSVNFLPYLEQGGRDTWTRNDIIMTQGATLSPIKGLKLRTEFSANFTYRDRQRVRSKVNVIENQDLTALRIGNGFSATDYIINDSQNNQYYVSNTTLDYTFQDLGDHNLKGLVGFNQEWGSYNSIQAQAFGLITPQITNLNATTGSQITSGGIEDISIRGVFYRLEYNYKEKYLFEANGRYDGSSRFPTDDRFGFFPSFSAGWRISQEDFMAGTEGWLDNLKLRVSYGTLGNQQILNNNGSQVYYPAIPTLGAGSSPYLFSGGQRAPFVSAAGLVSPSLTWESVTTKNLGLDFSLMNNKIDVSADIYTRDTKDMLTGVDYPDILGVAGPDANAADLRTSGWELSATYRNRINKDWNFGVTLALSDSKSEITKYDNPTGSLSERYVGQVIGERWGFVTEGIFQTQAEVDGAPDQSDIGNNWRAGDIRYADLNGDGVISRGGGTLDDPGDQVIIANEAPRHNFGINTNVGYKNFSLNFFFQGVMKYQYWPPNGNWVAFYPFNAGHVENYYLTDTWSEDNPDAYFPAPHISTNTKQNVQAQTRYVQNGAYIRLKNLTLNYQLPRELMSKAGLTDASIYFAGANLFEFTSMRRPLDPEVRPTLTQEYYKQRSYSMGVRITL